MSSIDATVVQLDLCGLRCPLPLLRLKIQLAQLPAGQRLQVRCTDPGAAQDIPRFLQQAGHELIAQTSVDGILGFDLRKRKD